MKERIYLASPHMSEQGYEEQYVKEAFETNWVAPLGPNVTNFEKDDRRRCLLFNLDVLSIM